MVLHFGSGYDPPLLCWREVFGQVLKDDLFLIGECGLELVGAKLLLARVGIHVPQVAQFFPDHNPALRRQGFHVLVGLPDLFFLFLREAFPIFHIAKGFNLLLWCQAIEPAEGSEELGLPVCRQTFESRVAFQQFLLLIQGQVFVVLQPIT